MNNPSVPLLFFMACAVVAFIFYMASWLLPFQ